MVAPAAAPRVREVVEPAVAGAGLLLEGLEVAGAGARTVVRVVVDLTDGDEAELDLDRIGEVTQAVSDALDATDVLPGAYTLEVSSPGVDRPLTQPRHWRRAVGRKVTLVRGDGTAVTGRLSDVGAGGEPEVVVVPVTDPGKGRRPKELPPVAVPWADVRSGRVEVDLSGVGTGDDDVETEG
ncbi:ribosome maturation factor RimP [Cellulomonas sp. JZ18]|uniref:ribosome maturation factor RimP n=1 Tax=Cellulomonas sp. JZ18 TaxID=2654191 RepID=UPI0012D43863|nr:ribosome maturation factor RimP [Cellulomonas sp. JZ18]QGQ19656.1 ribosome maturation factor RimP [Cellulomonas sp. JZ18]